MLALNARSEITADVTCVHLGVTAIPPSFLIMEQIPLHMIPIDHCL